MRIEFQINSEALMLKLGQLLAKCCQPRYVIYLKGELGAGKTTLVRGFLRGLGYQGNVKSPTYTIVEQYEFPSANIVHFDLYRLRDAQELHDMGLQDHFQDNTICLIEWPERGMPLLQQADLVCEISSLAEDKRLLVCQSFSTKGETTLLALQKVLPNII